VEGGVMQFHDYKTMREPNWKGGTEEYLRWRLRQPTFGLSGESIATMCAGVELSWLTHDRPYYNVYPIAVELCLSTKLNMRWGDISFPVKTLALRFAVGHEPLSMKSVLARVPSHADWSTPIEYHVERKDAAQAGIAYSLMANRQTTDASGGFWCYASPNELCDEVICDSLAIVDLALSSEDVSRKFSDQTNFLIRLLAFLGLLASGTDLITPAILASDRDEYDNTSDESRKRWLEERARKKLGVAFDVGRKFEEQRIASPHWRAPHLALFHTGPGRKTRTLKLRSGCVVIPRDMSQVPTGFLGPETQGELDAQACQRPPIRESIPKRLRFKVLRRDGYRCRLCGLTCDDGVTLEVDHMIARAKGGRTEEKNLWTLCHPCNNGKSDSDLVTATEATDGTHP
jgi:hypothetical protein